MRVAVAGAFRKVLQGPAQAREPLVDALHLAAAKTGNAGHAAGEAPPLRFGLGGDEVRNAELAGNGRGHEAVGGSHDGAEITGSEMRTNQCARPRRDHRHYPGAHELGVPAGEVLRGMLGQRSQREAEVFMDVERTGHVLLVVCAVLRLVCLALENAAIDQELPPLVVAVAGKERVVEVEQGEAHESASVYPRVFPASEAALDADAEVVQAEKTGRVAGQCFGAYGPVVREPVAAKHRILTRVVLGFPAADIRHAETAPVTE